MVREEDPRQVGLVAMQVQVRNAEALVARYRDMLATLEEQNGQLIHLAGIATRHPWRRRRTRRAIKGHAAQLTAYVAKIAMDERDGDYPGQEYVHWFPGSADFPTQP